MIFYVGLKYWPSRIKYSAWDEDTQNSGDYIFRPVNGIFESLGYTNLTESFFLNGTHFQQFDLQFKNADPEAKDERKAVIHISIDQDLPVVRVDVDLGSLPEVDIDGYEVVAEFKAEGIDNNQTFWTDSNGLEMQKRILNYRPTWDLVHTNYNDSL